MSTPNPLAPQGSLLEKQGRGRSTFQIISFIGAIHVVALCGLLWIGCKKDDQSGNAAANADAQNQGFGGLPPEGGLPPVGTPAYGTAPATNALPPAYAAGAPGATSYYGGPVTPVPAAAAGAPAPVPGGVTGPVVGLPPVETPLAPAPAAAASEYKVQKGDFGTTIARKHGVTLAELKAANPSVNWSKLRVDQVIAIPARSAAGAGSAVADAGAGGVAPAAAVDGGTTYTVRPGDTGSKIAKKFGVTWKAIRTANGLTSDNIRPNQKLTIPAKGTVPTAPSAGAPGGGGGVVVPTATPLPPVVPQ